MRINKRFGPRNFVQYLHLKHQGYSVIQKPKNKQKVYVPGVKPFYRPPRNEEALRNMQQSFNSNQFTRSDYQNSRNFNYYAKSLPPVNMSYDKVMDPLELVASLGDDVVSRGSGAPVGDDSERAIKHRVVLGKLRNMVERYSNGRKKLDSLATQIAYYQNKNKQKANWKLLVQRAMESRRQEIRDVIEKKVAVKFAKEQSKINEELLKTPLYVGGQVGMGGTQTRADLPTVIDQTRHDELAGSMRPRTQPSYNQNPNVKKLDFYVTNNEERKESSTAGKFPDKLPRDVVINMSGKDIYEYGKLHGMVYKT